MKDPNIEASKGDILTEVNSKDTHYLIYLEPYPNIGNSFIGALLTHSQINENIPLQKDHFFIKDENEKEYDVTFDNSFVSNHPVYKKINGDSFKKLGQLTAKGILFIEQNIAPYIQQFIPHNLY
ncbi:MAG: hypothetical protein ABIN01_21980 [Ferruginibacter sp.]